MERVDYLVIGAGAVGMAFVDTLIAEDPEATVLIVDRHAVPGGHWNDAYPFVRLHQPSAFYGVESLELGRGEIDRSGPNEGYYELAGCAEVLAYYERVMREFIDSGRVTFWPMTDYREGRCIGILSGDERRVEATKRVVDTTYFDTQVPATHKPRFTIEPGTPFMPTGELPDLVRKPDAVPSHFVVLGGGKTAMDTAGWLLGNGVAPERMTWVRPRDSWLINRRYTQPGLEFFEGTIDFQSALMRAAITADTVADYFLELEQGGHMLRLDPD
ncbi:MAG: NAD(P)/FAD-dependent oxidoreductase, partial [Sphingomonadaceae bacterium]